MHSKRRQRPTLRQVMTALAAAVFLISAGLLVRDLFRSARERQANEELVRLAEADTLEQESSVDTSQAETAERNYLPLWEQNSDLAAWLILPGTQLDYPVLYTPEEPEYYLRRAFDGSYAVSGSLFLGSGSTPDSNHVMIYGHYMRNGTMFGLLDQYADPAYWQDHPMFQYDQIQADGSYQRHTFEVMAAFYSRVYRTEETGVFRFYYCQDLSQPEAFSKYVRQVKEAALYDTGVSAEYGDRLLTLTTCSYHTQDGRFVVVAREAEP